MLLTLMSSLVLTKLAMQVALKYRIGDIPGPRKVHKVFVPYLGGVAIFLSVVIGTAVSILILPKIAGPVPKMYYLLSLSCLLISLVGLYDDLKGLKFSVKFYTQIILAILVVLNGFLFDSIYIPFIGTIHLGLFSYIFAIRSGLSAKTG